MIYIIAAVAKNRVIGNEGKIPWDLPEDREHFKNFTMGHSIVMGRRTYEEIGFPLPGRMTYLVSSTRREEGENITTVKTLSEAITLAGQRETPEGEEKKIFICGGERLYEEALYLADCLYLTEIHEEREGDAFFPEVDREVFVEAGREEKGKFDFVEYRRKQGS